jgi:hypothetical protein
MGVLGGLDWIFIAAVGPLGRRPKAFRVPFRLCPTFWTRTFLLDLRFRSLQDTPFRGHRVTAVLCAAAMEIAQGLNRYEEDVAASLPSNNTLRSCGGGWR